MKSHTHLFGRRSRNLEVPTPARFSDSRNEVPVLLNAPVPRVVNLSLSGERAETDTGGPKTFPPLQTIRRRCRTSLLSARTDAEPFFVSRFASALARRAAGPLTTSFLACLHIISIAATMNLAACGKKDRPPVSLEGKPTNSRLLFRDAAGRELTMKDLEGVSGEVRWEVIGGGTIPPEATRLHDEARRAGGRGDYARALELLDRAHHLAPDWPYPVYDAAFTYLLQGDSIKAEERYAEVDRMAPRGFFTAKTSLDCLRREHAGTLSTGFCKAFASLEWIEDKDRKKALLEGLVAKFPAYPAAWKELSGLLEDDEARLQAIGRGLEHEPDGETKGMLLINKALILDRRGDRDGAIKILGELALDPQSTLGTEVLAKATLAQVVR